MSDIAQQLNREVRLLVGSLCIDKLELQIALAQAQAELAKLKEKDEPCQQ
jgi:hypothetical protein